MKKLRFEVEGSNGISFSEQEALFIVKKDNDLDKHVVWLTDDNKVMVSEDVEDYGKVLLFYNTPEEYLEDHEGLDWIIEEAKKHF